ncbi:MAG TPA: D-alanyl-D-alanine carboxypeptidase family protein [Nitrosomonas sp.]|nr:D-alanyl-D-alanine carboxypeptidase family protein [Nitrosomonas sp.]HMY90483.1 D-alanyl-D-alanine carboxypeptidase family protein [Nitrosomonas sp.]HNB00983.1 D-alanyl-D-alanine carboxypeptidase family protein [Nitrosomonas sp.]HND35672.1 D-alanyl-D-alanine carboxypeptidase family protein [Nitrosomonas sp.]HNH52433.1 D-alanyl-D-alanine carboxypeptidase family protein [Nitrosomonas sp.]
MNFILKIMKLWVMFMVSLIVTPSFAQLPELSIAAKSYTLLDYQSGQTLLSQNAHERYEPASLTKLMTAYVVFSALKEKRISMDQVVPVSTTAWKMVGSRMFIEPNKPVTVKELINGMIVQSGNDACVALAELIAGSEDIFAQLMNKEAERLKMTNTHFMNSTGLSHPNHYSSAHDLSILASAIVRDFPEYYSLYSMRDFTYNGITQSNRNRLLWLDPNVDGMKTGWTDKAGYCLITSAKRDNRRLISVLMGAASESMRSKESQRLLNFGFQFFDTAQLYKKHQHISSIQVWKGSQNKLNVGFDHDVYFSLPKGQSEKLKAKMEYKQPLIAPINKGQEVGMVRFSIDDQQIAAYPLVALEAVDTAGIFGRAWDSVQMLFN